MDFAAFYGSFSYRLLLLLERSNFYFKDLSLVEQSTSPEE